MAHILEYILFTCCIVSLTMGFSVCLLQDYSAIKKAIFFAFSFCSAWWSFWYSQLIIQTDPEKGYLFRSIAMPGVILFLILCTLIAIDASKIKRKAAVPIFAFSLLGIIILPFNIRRSAIHFFPEKFGMSYSFVPGFWTSTYNIYTFILFINLLIMIIYMLRKRPQKQHLVLGKQLLACSLVIFSGSILDTLLPLFGFGAFPGSTLTQFIATVIVFSTIRLDAKNEISFANFSNIILYSFTTPVLLMDKDHLLRLANDAALSFFRLNEKQLEGVHLESLFEKLDVSPILNKEKFYLESEDIVMHRDCSLTIDKLYDDYKDTLGYVVVINDISERKRFINELMEARNMAENANEAKSSFLANMSHEIRTPINAVLGMDEMILRETNLDAIKDYAANIRTSGKALLSIINDILDFSKIESGKMELIIAPFNLSSTIFDLMTSLSLRAKEKNLLFECHLEPDAPQKLLGDEIRIKQIIMNLLTNSIKYTHHGTVSLSIHFERKDRNHCLMSFIVKDSGIGIKEEDIPNLFASFNRLDGQKNYGIEGTGLGLSIVSNLIELMHGTIEVESEYGVGSTFTAKIPLEVLSWEGVGEIRDFTKEATDDNAFTECSFTAPEAAILSVDDNRINLKVFKGLLKDTKMRIDLATSGEQCLTFLQKKKYDIIFLDHMMPGMDGVETLKRIQTLENNLSKNAPVIALTAHALSGAREQYFDYGFDDYLSKPIDYLKLEKLLLFFLPKEKVHPIKK